MNNSYRKQSEKGKKLNVKWIPKVSRHALFYCGGKTKEVL